MARQEFIDNKLPLAISFMILCNTGDKSQLQYLTEKVKRLARPLYFRDINEENRYLDYKNHFSSELFNSTGSEKIRFIEDSEFFNDIFKHVSEYQFYNLRKCYYHFWGNSISLPRTISSVEDIKKYYKVMLQNRTKLKGKDFDVDYCWNIARLFISAEDLSLDGKNDIFDFILNYIDKVDDIQSIEMAFHGGTKWIIDDDRVRLLLFLLKKDIDIYIIVNDETPQEYVFEHLREDGRTYIPLNENFKLWKDYQKRLPTTLHVKVSQAPLFRKYAAINMKVKEYSVIYTSFYTYNNPYIEINYTKIFEYNSKYFDIFKNQFAYLWSKASDEISSNLNGNNK